jgi:hypothetical protein
VDPWATKKRRQAELGDVLCWMALHLETKVNLVWGISPLETNLAGKVGDLQITLGDVADFLSERNIAENAEVMAASTHEG